MYAYANDETRYQPALRHMTALIPVDIAFKFSLEHEEQRLVACRAQAGFQGLFDSGVYYSSGEGLRAIGFLAATAPAETSPIIRGGIIERFERGFSSPW